ncbi:hypothetical protein LCGC14_1751270 [marine sediment metagenome]|uniref:Uncharacterized protein n=1 Tax=marine sediment metagenome TaxID=412755 RepID=A0A0F9K378_9ZZZZ
MGKLIVVMYVAITLLFLGLAMVMDDRHHPATDGQTSYVDVDINT